MRCEKKGLPYPGSRSSRFRRGRVTETKVLSWVMPREVEEVEASETTRVGENLVEHLNDAAGPDSADRMCLGEVLGNLRQREGWRPWPASRARAV